ncbi:OmpA family protein [Nonomuraea typhae]|uniref:OmpA family protein n=1 Tax=Nonomuraea typhae TaxID=2603600 RepID=UPI0012FBFFEA|nr:OmpA family protein [Nonomuraea typhae]
MSLSLSLAAVLIAVSPTPPPAATLPVEDLVFPVEDIVPEVESLDGAESETKQGDQVRVALTSDVLFALDKWTLTAKAGRRLTEVAAKIKAEGAGGVVTIEGHTDDQGADAYNLTLSRRRAEAVRRALQGGLTGTAFDVKGYGEARPKLANLVDGRPQEKNRAKNRRVEIVFTAAR